MGQLRKGSVFMKQFEIEIRETLSRTLNVMADSEAQAIGKIKEAYFNSSVVLDADDFSGVAFYVVDIKGNLVLRL